MTHMLGHMLWTDHLVLRGVLQESWSLHGNSPGKLQEPNSNS